MDLSMHKLMLTAIHLCPNDVKHGGVTCPECLPILQALQSTAQEAREAQKKKDAGIARDVGKGLDNEWNKNLGKANDLVDTCEDIAQSILNQEESK